MVLSQTEVSKLTQKRYPSKRQALDEWFSMADGVLEMMEKEGK